MIPDQVIAVLIAACCLVPVAILAMLVRRAHRDRLRVRAIVLGLTLVHELVLVVYPALYAGCTGFQIEAGVGVAPQDLVVVAIGEMVFVVLFWLGLNLGVRTLPARRRHKLESEAAGDGILLYGLVLGAVVLYVGRMLGPTFTYKDLATHYQAAERSGVWDALLDWAGTLVQWPGLIAAAFVAGDASKSRKWRIAGATALVAELMFAMVNGLRGGVVWVISLVAIAAYYKSRKRLLVVAAVLVIAIAPMFSWLHSTMRYVSFAAPLGTSRWQLIPAVIDGIMHHDTVVNSAIGGNFMEAWAIRAEGPRNGTVLFRLHDQGDAASYKPILGALLLPIPRMFWPDKPAAGSTDSTNLGSAMYRVEQGKPNASFYDMGPVLASAHSYWEGGWMWLCGAALISGFMWETLLSWAERARQTSIDIVVLAFSAALPIDGFFGGLNPVFAYVRVVWITLIPLSAAILLLHRLRTGGSALAAGSRRRVWAVPSTVSTARAKA